MVEELLVYNNLKFTLLEDGRSAFPPIINAIREAKKSIKINMFIWRADNIGLQIAKELLSAAQRGVNVQISVDRYGMVLELAEESMLSFFHERPTFTERVKIWALKLFYQTKEVPFSLKEEARFLRDKLLNHKNVFVSRDAFKADHSKYYLIDNSILFLGGINIEDKENDCDYLGRVYQDYMIKIADNRAIDSFLNKISGKNTKKEGFFFGVNLKAVKPRLFEMEELYLDIINSARNELVITMAYFSPVKSFIDAIVKASNRGVKVSVTIPKSANFQGDLNMKTAKLLLQKSQGKIELYLSPKMVHTKLVMNESMISLGSCNINKKAFKQLDELNLFVERTAQNRQFEKDLLSSVKNNREISKKVSLQEVKYSKIRAFIEGFLM